MFFSTSLKTTLSMFMTYKMEVLAKENLVRAFEKSPSSACHELRSSGTMLPEERIPWKIHNTTPFEAAPEPNIVTHITELSSHFP